MFIDHVVKTIQGLERSTLKYKVAQKDPLVVFLHLKKTSVCLNLRDLIEWEMKTNQMDIYSRAVAEQN